MIESAIAEYFPLLLIASGIVSVVGIRTCLEVFQTISRERSRREIAAYVAEGLMTPEQGERLVNARIDASSKPSNCT
ncbi:MAG: hypothetical protein AAF432_08470 [Planctomycetota bacterium]